MTDRGVPLDNPLQKVLEYRQPLLRNPPESYRILWNYTAVRAITSFKVIQGHRVWYPDEGVPLTYTIVSAVTVGGLFLWPDLRYGTGYQTVWETRPSAETPSDVHWRRFYFQLTCVHSALELSGRCALHAGEDGTALLFASTGQLNMLKVAKEVYFDATHSGLSVYRGFCMNTLLLRTLVLVNDLCVFRYSA